MSETMEVAPEVKELADKFVNLSVLQAQQLADYLKEEYGIEPAGGGVAMVAGPAAGDGDGAADAGPTSFKVVLKSKGGSPIKVIKVVRAATNLGLKEAKELVDSAPSDVKTGISDKEEAEGLVNELTEAGAEAEVVGE